MFASLPDHVAQKSDPHVLRAATPPTLCVERPLDVRPRRELVEPALEKQVIQTKPVTSLTPSRNGTAAVTTEPVLHDEPALHSLVSNIELHSRVSDIKPSIKLLDTPTTVPTELPLNRRAADIATTDVPPTNKLRRLGGLRIREE